MKTLTRISLDELVKTMPIVSEEEQNSYIGGEAPKRYTQSCVFNVFNYLDGDRYDNAHYADTTYENLGVSPDASGNISLSYVAQIGAIGGFDVEIVGSENKKELVASTGKTVDGEHLLIVIANDDGSLPHMVQVDGVILNENGTVKGYSYYDATNNKGGNANLSKISSIYYVGEKEDSSGGLTSTPQPSGSIQPSGNFD